jgi:hypothetical protein
MPIASVNEVRHTLFDSRGQQVVVSEYRRPQGILDTEIYVLTVRCAGPSYLLPRVPVMIRSSVILRVVLIQISLGGRL